MDYSWGSLAFQPCDQVDISQRIEIALNAPVLCVDENTSLYGDDENTFSLTHRDQEKYYSIIRSQHGWDSILDSLADNFNDCVYADNFPIIVYYADHFNVPTFYTRPIAVHLPPSREASFGVSTGLVYSFDQFYRDTRFNVPGRVHVYNPMFFPAGSTLTVKDKLIGYYRDGQ